MKKGIALIVLLLVIFGKSHGQDKGLTFLLGPSVNMYLGDINEKFSYSTESLSWQFNGQLGYISTRGGTTRGNMFGVFASGGNTQPEMVALMQSGGAELDGDINLEKNFNEFFSLEGGMVIARFLRLSGGIGRQYFTYSTGEHGFLSYFSGTLGFVFNLDVVNWVVEAQLMTGKDLNQKALRLSTGFMVKF